MKEDNSWKGFYNFMVTADINVWDEPEEGNIVFEPIDTPSNLDLPRQKLVAASLNQLCKYLMSPSTHPIDMNLMNLVVLCYPVFTTTGLLFIKISQAYRYIPQPNGMLNNDYKHNLKVTRLRAANMIKKLLSMKDFLTNEERTHIQNFIDNELAAFLPPIANSLTKSLVQSSTSSDLKFELSHAAWEDPDRYSQAPNIVLILNNNKKVTNWVTKELLSRINLQDRITMMVMFINIIEKLMNLNNYYTAAAMFFALQSRPVLRTNTQAELPEKQRAYLQELQNIFNLDNLYYRERLNSYAPPCIPWLTVHLQELAVLEKTKGNFGKLIDLKLLEKISDVLHMILPYKLRYQYQALPQIVDLLDQQDLQPHVTEEELLAMSSLCEPREM